MEFVARWASPKDTCWVELLVTAGRYSYVGSDHEGVLEMGTESAAVAFMQGWIDAGFFLPDDARFSMRLVVQK